MINPETHVQIRRYFYAGHWKIGTIARELNVHPDAVRNAIESDRFSRTHSIRPSVTDPYMEFVRQTLGQHPRLRATRICHFQPVIEELLVHPMPDNYLEYLRLKLNRIARNATPPAEVQKNTFLDGR
jgi:hypothetical protein